MYQSRPSVSDLRYNAASSAFEGIVTFHSESGRIRMASSFEAPLDTSYDAAVAGLREDAIRSLDRPDALRSRRAARRTQARSGSRAPAFPFGRLLGQFFGNRAA
ncbi:hypothetical protein SAMN05444413_1218 [Roseivivax marinus]|uniref:hypothetical protein n=1 Tax=Roseivivax marinus TaxID=1379903 RepID=UPI0008B1662A|nr:hypothetical protein [Roseivivax marinus]SEL90062.1 hypothetical protein SAMN05444413_1218 [Roseivivax marinus]